MKVKENKKKRHLKKWVKVTLFLLLIFILVFIVCCFRNETRSVSVKEKQIKDKEITTKQEDTNKLSMVMVGDCLIHRFVYTDAKNNDGSYSFSKMFTEVEPLIKNHDLAFYNQESNIGGKSLGLSAYPRFNSPEEIGDDMVDLGFNLVSLANNHTMDKGEQGVINSVNYWKTKPGVYYTGQALSEEDRESNIKIKAPCSLKTTRCFCILNFILDLIKRLLDVSDDVVRIFYAAGKADHIRRYACLFQFFFRKLAVRGGCRVQAAGARVCNVGNDCGKP